jgi:hypothetical protein
MSIGKLAMTGRLDARVRRAKRASIWWKIRNFSNVWPGLWRHALAKALRMNHMLGTLHIVLRKATGEVINYGLASTQLVTDAFVEFMVDELQAETSVWGDFKYHDSGIGVTGANVADTDIETTDGEARATGTQLEGATAEIYKSVGTITYTSTKAITEHGLFSTLAAATLMDRHTFAAINVVNTDSIEFTYQLTCTSGG